ncbi:Transport of quorum-sensing signal protein [Thalassovita mediterranea]|uniref:Transport of quorum-sensing signal protein n=3 Tax=Thalassovita mediterranea TaxID=340021 RepID=A0A0P1H207_9RHOB|nr:Transport of quorum-sensing signal protein [Thalassovita mediterranea]SIS33991.1 Predicted PurR-regulated permease PerM [Thalassovita mediterranea]
MNQSPHRPPAPRHMQTGPIRTGMVKTSQMERVQTGALIIIALAVVLFLLVQARFLLISLATAIVLFSLTSDAINFIARQRIGPFRIPNTLATITALLLISAGMLTLTSIILSQINTVLTTTLNYAASLPRAVAAMFAWLGEDVETSVFNTVSSINVGSYLSTAAGGAGNLMSATVLVILFVGFLFAERIWFSTKLVALAGNEEQAERVSRIIATIIHRVNYYLLVKTGVSAITGVMVWGVATFFQLDLAVALGILTFVLNYIPNIGSIVATILVALVAFVEIGEPGPTAAIFATVTVIQFINGSVIDPMLMGRALRLSSFGIIINLAFWGAVWGVPGMFLSVPIMVAMMIIFSQIPELRSLAILLSREGLPEQEEAPHAVDPMSESIEGADSTDRNENEAQPQQPDAPQKEDDAA